MLFEKIKRSLIDHFQTMTRALFMRHVAFSKELEVTSWCIARFESLTRVVKVDKISTCRGD